MIRGVFLNRKGAYCIDTKEKKAYELIKETNSHFKGIYVFLTLVNLFLTFGFMFFVTPYLLIIGIVIEILMQRYYYQLLLKNNLLVEVKLEKEDFTILDYVLIILFLVLGVYQGRAYLDSARENWQLLTLLLVLVVFGAIVLNQLIFVINKRHFIPKEEVIENQEDASALEEDISIENNESQEEALKEESSKEKDN